MASSARESVGGSSVLAVCLHFGGGDGQFCGEVRPFEPFFVMELKKNSHSLDIGFMRIEGQCVQNPLSQKTGAPV